MIVPAVGIDLGTTYSLVATRNDTGLEVHPAVDNERSSPSVVQIQPDGGVSVGQEAKRGAAVYPERTFGFFKRDMGRNDRDRTVDGRVWSPVDLSSIVLRSLGDDVERARGTRAERAVVTIPAYFGDAARRATVSAAEHAGLEVLALIHEPTAAALAAGFGGPRGLTGTVLVYDLGGGTFDVSLVSIEADDITVIATDGDHELGGKDWDDELIALVADAFVERHGEDPRLDPIASAALRWRSEDAKRALSRLTTASVPLVYQGVADRVPVARKAFESATRGLLGRTQSLLEHVLDDAGMGWADIDATLLVGGSTRMPMCAELLERLSGRRHRPGLDPDLAVVGGAALVAARHDAPAGQQSSVTLPSLPAIRDATAHALGFVVINATGDRYVNQVMLERNVSIPAVARQRKRLDGGVTELDVYVLQGHAERPLATEPLGRWRFSGVPGEQRGRDVDIAFAYDGDGIVQVSAEVGGRPLDAPQHDADDVDLSWTDEDPRERRAARLNVAMCIDCSGSMSGAPITEAKRSCVEFVEILGKLPGVSLGLISFASGARIEAPVSDGTDRVCQAAEALTLYGGTEMDAGIDEAGRALMDADEGRRVIVLLTDGSPNDPESARASAARGAEQGIDLLPIGVGAADMTFLNSIGTTDRDSVLTDLGGLTNEFRSIARTLAGGLSRRL